jgi:hypothetical protein
VTGYAFVRVIFVAAVVAIVIQCAVYPIRRTFGMAVALRVLRASLYGFLGIAGACFIWGASTGELAQGLSRAGWRPLVDMGFFIGFCMFIAYFMGSRYLADELDRARAGDAVFEENVAPRELGNEG